MAGTVGLSAGEVGFVATADTQGPAPPLFCSSCECSLEGAYALKLAQLFSPRAGAGLSLSSRLLVRDLNAPHAPLLQLLLLDCHGLLAPGVCTAGVPEAPGVCAPAIPQACTSGMACPRATEGRSASDVTQVGARMRQLGLTSAEETGVQGGCPGTGTPMGAASPESSHGVSRVPGGSMSNGAYATGDEGSAAEASEGSGGSSGRALLCRAVRVMFRGTHTTASSELGVQPSHDTR